jgi:hypothetical protein
LAQYKKSVEWGNAVKSYLRRESNGCEKNVWVSIIWHQKTGHDIVMFWQTDWVSSH